MNPSKQINDYSAGPELLRGAVEGMTKHSEDGPLSLATLLQGIAFHLPHHVAFIEEKRKAM